MALSFQKPMILSYTPANFDSNYGLICVLGHEVEAQYSLKAADQLAHELLDMILHFSGVTGISSVCHTDVMSSPTSASPFTLEELQKALTLAKTVKPRSRFYNYYGERHARLERTASVFADAENGLSRTWFIKISSPPPFFIPDSNLKSFQKAYVDTIVHKYDWEHIMKTLNHEWKQMVLLATPMLNVDVGFLSVQGVKPLQTLHTSPAQISIYVSIIFNVGSIALGSQLVRLHKGSNTYDYDFTAEYAIDINFPAKANHPIVGLEKPAILYSLPCALAIWR
ncbi:hypothetical protein CVT25_003194 [Psilocybe cyanescens]|uniref:Uncharacterized protein n=1 Tax=Psilocybe cyanescens TaxID=93625 RepID=A0A409XFF1_PSICY|nr:hypothetical protein CVT25_003194 [Psilocybe cyanescens]